VNACSIPKNATTPFLTHGSYNMRCYFMRGGRIEAVEELAGLSDEQAIAKAHALFSERKHKFEGFELWNRATVIIRHPEPAASNNVAAWPLHRGVPRALSSVRTPAGPRKTPLKA
jgi:hypothetical protein